MKPGIKEFLILIFLALSLWLSFEVKSGRNEIARIQFKLEQAGNQNALLIYRLDNWQEAFALNFGMAPKPIIVSEIINNPVQWPLVVLYLKAYACSPCHMPVIHMLIDRVGHDDNFRIASHASNKHFLLQVLSEEELTCPDRVIWLKGPFYQDKINQYDAKILLVDYNGLITGMLPLEMLREEDLFADLKEQKLFGLY